MQNNTFFEDSSPNNIIVFEELASTNDYLKELLSKVKPLEPYTVIMAKKQTAGKGQRGNLWISAANQNLTASFLLSPTHLELSKQFLITMVSSLAVYDTIYSYCPNEISIKWPNDILIKNKKIAGILIENKIAQNCIKHSIVGIGVNVLQQDFPLELKHKTTSLSSESQNIEFEILQIAETIQHNLKFYFEKALLNTTEIIQLYNERLYNKDKDSSYIIENKATTGVIKQVDLDGLLQIKIDNKIHKVDLKGITYIL